MSPKRVVAPPAASAQVRQRGATVLRWLGRVDRRLWPLITGATVLLVAVLLVIANIPGAGMFVALTNVLLFGCALWFLYECIRHLILTRTSPTE